MFALLLLLLTASWFQQISSITGHEVHHPNVNPSLNFLSYHDDETPEKFYVTHEAWFNISISENKFSSPTRSEKIVIALFGEICPMTVTNFITITKGLRRGSVKTFDSLCSEFLSLNLLDEICLQRDADPSYCSRFCHSNRRFHQWRWNWR